MPIIPIPLIPLSPILVPIPIPIPFSIPVPIPVSLPIRSSTFPPLLDILYIFHQFPCLSLDFIAMSHYRHFVGWRDFGVVKRCLGWR